MGVCWDVTERHRMTADLASERHLLSTLMDNLPDNIYFKVRESRFLVVNQAMLTWTGFKDQSEIIGKSDQDLFADEHASAALADEQKIIATGFPNVHGWFTRAISEANTFSWKRMDVLGCYYFVIR